MHNAASVAIGITIIVAVSLIGYWFWVPDVGALRTWDEFRTLPTMECVIDDAGVKGLTGTMYILRGELRADYKVEGDGIAATFHTIIHGDGTTYTWADNINFAERTKINLGEGSTEENLFKISRCKRVWDISPEYFTLPSGLQFTERGE